MVSEIFSTLTFTLVSLLIIIPVNAALLLLAFKIFKKQTKYTSCLILSAIVQATSLIVSYLILGVTMLMGEAYIPMFVVMIGGGLLNHGIVLLLHLTLPKILLKLDWKSGILIGLTWYGLSFVAGMVISLILIVVGAMLVYSMF